MPSILVILGWRLFFYANEGSEPVHIHCRNGDMECKYWLKREIFEIHEAFSYNMTERDKRQIRKIIYNHFEYIEDQWDDFQRRRLQ
jgi:hypothetical protein